MKSQNRNQNYQPVQTHYQSLCLPYDDNRIGLATQGLTLQAGNQLQRQAEIGGNVSTPTYAETGWS